MKRFKEHSIHSFVIRNSRMNENRQKDYDALGHHCLEYKEGNVLDLASIFPEAKSVVVEIGFGMGDATWEIALKNPDIGYLAIEVYRPGIVKLMRTLEEKSIKNIKIIEYDAVSVLETMIAPLSISGVHIFFPDPWPKKKHHKRRLFVATFLNKLAPILADEESYVYFVTDWEDYALQALDEANKSLLQNTAEMFIPSLSWRPQTKFERKGIKKQHQIFELLLKKG